MKGEPRESRGGFGLSYEIELLRKFYPRDHDH